MLDQLAARFTASAEAEAAARSATDRMAGRLESVARTLRRPVSLLHGAADHWAHPGRPTGGDPDRALSQIAGHAAAAEAALDEVDNARLAGAED
jgi:hypothetical protein